MNLVILRGNLGANSELRHTASGKAVLSFRLATTETYWDGEREQERTEWHTVSLWGKRGAALAPHLTKGKSVLVSGRLETRKYAAADGTDRYATQVVCTDIELLGGGGKPDQRERGEQAPPHDDGDDIPF